MTIKRIKKFIIFISLVIAILAVAHLILAPSAFALDAWNAVGGSGDQFAGDAGLAGAGTNLYATITNIIRWFIGFLGIIAVMLIIYAGFLWMTAAGNEQRIEKAKKVLIGALIGLLLIIFSFAIVSFIFNALTDITTPPGPNYVCDPPCAAGEYCCSYGCSISPCVPSSGDYFRITKTIPTNKMGQEEEGVIRNVVIKVYFNKAIANTVTLNANNFKVEKVNNVDPNTGALTAPTPPLINSESRDFANDRRIVTFKDTDPCNNPENTPNCFPPWSRFKVTIDGNSIISINNQSLSCDNSSPCQFYFSTGHLIDVSGPQAGIESRQMCQNVGGILDSIQNANLVDGWAKDDTGVADIQFCSEKQGGTGEICFPQSIKTGGIGQTNLSHSYKYDTSGYQKDDYYTFRVRASDVVGQLAQEEFTTQIRAGHCCNGIKDGGESDVDCGGECGACDGAACANDISIPATCSNNLCASQFCTTLNSNPPSNPTECEKAGYAPGTTSCCICQRQPVITGVFPVGGFCENNRACSSQSDCEGAICLSTGFCEDNNTACLADEDCPGQECNQDIPNGAPGNFVTIIGINFGANQGSGLVFFNNEPADLASGPGCAQSWSDTQIIAVVPNTSSGPIKVTTGAGFSDDSTLNPPIPDFLVNTIARPGLCQLSPDKGAMNTLITYSGIKLTDTQTHFGKRGESVPAIISTVVNDKQLTATVPNITTGKTSSFVINETDNVYSNYLIFTKEPEPYAGPIITSFDPVDGATGQYVTIRGKGFGATRGNSKVYFGAEIGSGTVKEGVEADFNFPEVCADSIWSDKQVIVKVPAEIKNTVSGLIAMEIAKSGGQNWLIDTSKLTPSQFSFEQDKPLAPSLCKIKPIMGQVGDDVSLWGEYFGVQDTNSKVRFYLNYDQSGAAIKSWGQDPDKSVTTVHQQAVTGPVRVVKNSPEVVGNGLNFTVGTCKIDSECGATNFCCPKGTPFVGRCRDGVDVQEACFPEYNSSVYEWDFDTEPGPGDPCYNGAKKGYCDITQSKCTSPYVCNTTSCLCQEPVRCDTNVNEPGCQAGACDPGYYCNQDCICKVSTCDTNVNEPGCQAGACDPGYYCNQDCICKVSTCDTNVNEPGCQAGACDPGFTCNNSCLCIPAPAESCSGYGNLCADTYFCPNSPGKCSVSSGSTLSNGLIGWWTFDSADIDIAGKKASDSSGQDQDGTLNNLTGSNIVPGRIGQALKFNGSNTYVDTPLKIDDEPISYAAWVKPESIYEPGCFLCTDNAVWDKGTEVRLGKWNMHVGNAEADTGKPVSAGQWYHVVTVYTSSNIILYVNGSKEWERLSGPGDDSGSTVQIGRAWFANGNGSRFFNGLIDDVRVYNRALSSDEVNELYSGSRIVGDCDFSCNSLASCSKCVGGAGSCLGKQNGDVCGTSGYCQLNLCEYEEKINRCVKKIDPTCDLPKTVQDVNSHDVEAICVNSKWQISTNYSCPTGWTNIGGGKCTENTLTCFSCDIGFNCLNQDGAGVCAVDTNVCPAGSICTGNNKCAAVAPSNSASCDCCCRAGHDAEDCCAPLKCQGTCGSGTSSTDDTFGLCTGCTVRGTNNLVDISASNDACNCSGTSGKYCDTSAAGGQGVCKDCAQLTTALACSTAGVGSCCVDAKISNACRGGEDYVSEPPYNYCAYYNCGTGVNANSCDTTKVKDGDYKTDNCDNQCQKPDFGENCSAYNASPSCDINRCVGFSCLTDTGNIPSTPPCGTCCCDPDANPDQCAKLKLTCKPNQSPCTSDTNERGLCCGCTDDNSCDSPDTNGCGQDTCCHARPAVAGQQPAPFSENVCRNAVIQATFSQSMQTESFNGNIIVAGYYNLDPCPADTEYLTAAYKPTFLARVKSVLAKIPLVKKLFTSDAMALTGNFCAIKGTVSGYDNAVGKSVLEFRPEKVLAPSRQYYVIIKGDGNTADAIREGVLSAYGVGMTPVPFSPNSQFNGKTYNGKIWFFTTRPDSGDDHGICKIVYAELEPASYLFQTNKDNITDNDPNDKAAFDKIKDSDKLFAANAYAADGTVLYPLTDIYYWTWGWSSSNEDIFKVLAPTTGTLPDNKKLVKALPTVTTGEAEITATATVVGTGGGSFPAEADVYLMVCDNPWPQMQSDGTWEPWEEPSGCPAGGGTCTPTNMKLSYCRDAGGPGTADDLPAISNTATIRGMNLICRSNSLNCDDGTGDCTDKIKGDICSDKSGKCDYNSICSCSNSSCSEANSINTPCGSNSGTCQVDILKEFYFFRESLPSAASNLEVTALDSGGGVSATWDIISGATGYKVYYGTKPKTYTKSVPSTGTSATINNLTNGVKYYFAVTSLSSNGDESAYSNEVTVVPADTTPPVQPASLSATPKDRQVALTWTENDDTAVNYRVFYKANDTCGANVNFGASFATNNKTATTSNLTNGIKYCFGVVAYDSSGNKSATTTVAATPFASAAVNLSLVSVGNGEVKVRWEAASGANSYKVYYNTNGGDTFTTTIVATSTAGTATNPQIIPVTNGLTYKFIVRSIADNIESANSNIISARPFAPPANLALRGIGDRSVRLSWDAAPGAVSYRVYYNQGGTVFTKFIASSTAGTAANPQVITGLTNGVTYNLIVRSVNADGKESVNSDKISAKPFAPPANLALRGIGNGSVRLSWDAASGAVSYRVYYNQGGTVFTKFVASPTAGTAANPQVVTGLTNSTLYNFIVRSIDADSRESANSNTISATPINIQ